MDPKVKGHARSNSSSVSSNSDVFEPISSNNAKHRAPLVEWLNSILPDLSLPINASDEELRAFLIDGSILCQLLNKLKPGSPPQLSDVSRQNVEKFLLAMDEMGLPRFQVEDLEKGSMKIVLESLLTLQTHIMLRDNESNPRWKSEGNSAESTPKNKPFRVLSSPPFGEERRKLAFASKSQRGLRSPKSPASVTSNSGHKLHEVFQLKQGSYTDLPAAKISEMMKSNSLDNAPTQSLLSVINGILDESVEMKNGEIPHRVAGLLRKVVQEIERRICTQAEHLRTQNNLFKAREEKYQSRIRVLEALATGTSEETQIVMNQLQQIKNEKNKIEEKKKVEDHDTVKLMKEKDELNQEIENLKQELERARRLSEEASSEIEVTNDKDELIRDIENLKQELKRSKRLSEEASSEIKVTNDKGELIQERANLKQELERSRRLSEEESLKIKVSNDKDELIQEIANLKRELERARRASEEESLKVKVSNDKDEVIQEMANLKLELERARRASEEESLNGKDIVIQEIANLKQELERARRSSEEESLKIQVKNDKDEVIQEIANLKHELERARRSNEEESLKVKVTKDKDEVIQEIGNLRQELKEKEVLNEEIMNLRQELKEKEGLNQEIVNLRKEVKEKEGLNQVIENLRQELKEKDGLNQEITNLKKELEIARKSIEEVSTKTKGIKDQDMENLRQKVKDNDELKQEIAHLKKELEIAGRSSTDQESSKMIHMKERDDLNQEIAKLRQEVREKDKLNQERDELKEEIVNLRQEIKEKDKLNQEIENMRHEVKEEKDKLNQEITNLKEVVSEKDKLYQEREKLREELEKVRGLHEEETSKAVGAQRELENRLKETASSLKESQSKVKELDALFESKTEWWNKKQHIYHIFTEFQLGALRELRFSSQSIQQEVVRTQKSNSEEFSDLRSRIRILGDAAKNYYPLLAENRKMHNELQELKGNIRVYCRIRPFLPGQKGRQSIIEHVGEDGELVVVNPSKPGKEGRRSFKFDKVYAPTAKQVDVYTDTQPLVQSVLDGYNVCIFAYGQTGSGKTYTMTGPDGASEEEWGVNYRALSDLFRISQSRGSIFKYEVSVQMVEIYNEQVRDLLSSDGPKKLGILSASQPSGLAVPDACIQPVNSTADVLKLMDIGLQNRAKSSTAMNERSSRSHSIVSIHTRGQDLKSGSSLRGSLHLVDLAGSERVDRSEVTGDRLKEAQHINKSLSALGDVIFALAQKSAHVPYRNSKLTQVLQSSLGGRAKTLMFVQLNPDAISFSETISTLKFAERVSGVELGAAKSSKDGKDVRELMEQVASLKDTIAKKDEEIEELHTAKDPKNGVAGDKRSTTSSRYSGEAEDSAQTTLLVKQGKLTTLLNLDRHLEFHEGPCQDQLGSVPGGLKWSDCLRKPIYQPSP